MDIQLMDIKPMVNKLLYAIIDQVVKSFDFFLMKALPISQWEWKKINKQLLDSSLLANINAKFVN